LADYVVSNDGDLLTLSPFEGIPIITPPLFLQQLDGDL
jgi:predicted nucleic acid-binding protein